MSDAQQVIADVIRAHQWRKYEDRCRCDDPGAYDEHPLHQAEMVAAALGGLNRHTGMGLDRPPDRDVDLMTDFTARVTEILREHQLVTDVGRPVHCLCGDPVRYRSDHEEHLAHHLTAAAEEHYRPRIETNVDDLAGDLYENHHDGHEPPETRPLTRGDCRVIAERLADLGWTRSPGAGE